MCNLYTLQASATGVAAYFDVDNAAASNAGEEVCPDVPGLVVRKDKGRRVMQSMTWGFPLRLEQ